MLQGSQWILKQNAHSLASSLKIQYQWVTLSFAETKVSNFSLRLKYQTKPLQLSSKQMQTKEICNE